MKKIFKRVGVLVFINISILSYSISIFADDFMNEGCLVEEITEEKLTDAILINACDEKSMEIVSVATPDFTFDGVDYYVSDTSKIKESGNYLGIEWYIYKDGMVYLTGDENSFDYEYDHPWDYRGDVYKVYCDFNPNGFAQDNLFRGCNCRKIEFGPRYNTAGCESFAYMFFGCNNLETLDVSHFNTSSVIDLDDYTAYYGSPRGFCGMFWECKKLKTLDVSHFDTSHAADFRMMFHDCESLEYLDLSAWDTSAATNFSQMFDGCKSLKELDVTGFVTDNVIDMNYMFKNCFELESIDVSNFNTSNIVFLGEMFRNCKSLKYVDCSNFRYSENFICNDNMFVGCETLEEIDMVGWDYSNIEYPEDLPEELKDLFTGCNNLKRITLPDNVGNSVLVLPHTMYDRENSNKEYTQITGEEGYGLELYSTKDDAKTKFSITYNLNGGYLEGVSNPTEYYYSTETFTLANPSREGYIFIGWTERQDSELKTTVTISKGSIGNLNFKANWKEDKITVTFDTGCDLVIDEQTVDDGCMVEPDEDSLIRFGYEFDGWYTDRSYTCEWDFDDPVEADMILYARWNIEYYDIDDDGQNDYSFAEADYYGTSLGVDWIIFDDGMLYIFGEQEEDAHRAADWGWNIYRNEVLKAQLNFDSEYSISYLLAGCTNLREVLYSEYADIADVSSTSHMFADCSSLVEVDVAQFGMADVVDTSYMFAGCIKIERIIFETDDIFFNVAYARDLSYMFRDCRSLKNLNLSSFSLDASENVAGMLSGCNALIHLESPSTWNLSIELPKKMYDRFMYNREYSVIPAKTDSMDLYSTIDETYHSIFVYTSKNGKAELSSAIEQNGYRIYIVLTPDDGYELDTFYSADIDAELLADGRITFIMPDKNVTLQVAFKKKPIKYLQEKIINEDGSYTFNLVKGQKYTVSEFRKLPKTLYKIIESKQDKKIATISAKGIVVAKNVGMSSIDLIIGNNAIHVSVNVYNPSFNYKNSKKKMYTLPINTRLALDFDAVGFKPKYMIDAKKHKIATVDPDTGIVTGHAKGKVFVYATVNGKKYKTKLQVI